MKQLAQIYGFSLHMRLLYDKAKFYENLYINIQETENYMKTNSYDLYEHLTHPI